MSVSVLWLSEKSIKVCDKYAVGARGLGKRRFPYPSYIGDHLTDTMFPADGGSRVAVSPSPLPSSRGAAPGKKLNFVPLNGWELYFWE